MNAMSTEFVTTYFMEALRTGMMLAAPCLLFGLVAGVFISMLQAATQINEMTLVFIPKMLAVGFALLIFFPWMLEIEIEFAQRVFGNLAMYVR